MSQEQLAQKAGITYSTLLKIESGVIRNPRIETVAKLADALGVSIDKLVERSRKKINKLTKGDKNG